MAVGETGERRGQPCVRVDACELAVLDQRGDHRPVVAVLVGAGGQRVFAVERKSPDCALDGVVVEIDATIVEEPDETIPAWKSVPDRLAKAALGADLPFTHFGEPVEVIDDRPAALVAGVPALVSGYRPRWRRACQFAAARRRPRASSRPAHRTCGAQPTTRRE